MRICRIHILCAAAVTALLASCYDDSYHGAAIFGSDDAVPIPVNVAVGSPLQPVTATRSHGLVSDIDDLDGRDIYVYAFSSKAESFEVTSAQDSKTCIVDASRDTPGSIAGKQAVLSSSYAYAKWTGDDIPYYPSGNAKSVPGKFFAYYIDDIQPEDSAFERGRDSVVVNFEIDGNQDIMTSTAGYYGEETPDSKYAFSYYSARRGIVPVFRMNHKLVRLDFEITPGVLEFHPKQVTVQGINVESPYKASLTVADRDSLKSPIRFDSSALKFLSLTEDGGQQLLQDHYILTVPVTQEEPTQHVGGCLLVAPAQQYLCTVDLSEEAAGKPKDYENELDLKYEGGFQPGCRYLVHFTIYGYTFVDVKVTLVPWKDGGTIYLEDDPYVPSVPDE